MPPFNFEFTNFVISCEDEWTAMSCYIFQIFLWFDPLLFFCCWFNNAWSLVRNELAVFWCLRKTSTSQDMANHGDITSEWLSANAICVATSAWHSLWRLRASGFRVYRASVTNARSGTKCDSVRHNSHIATFHISFHRFPFSVHL